MPPPTTWYLHLQLFKITKALGKYLCEVLKRPPQHRDTRYLVDVWIPEVSELCFSHVNNDNDSNNSFKVMARCRMHVGSNMITTKEVRDIAYNSGPRLTVLKTANKLGTSKCI